MLNSNPFFENLSKRYGHFYATMLIAKSARNACDSLQGRIPVSTAIDYIANYRAICPDDFPDHRLDVAEDYLCTICDVDQEVKDAVLASYAKSLDCDVLAFVYLSVKDKPRRRRVRILTKTLWDNRPNK